MAICAAGPGQLQNEGRIELEAVEKCPKKLGGFHVLPATADAFIIASCLAGQVRTYVIMPPISLKYVKSSSICILIRVCK